MLSRSLLLLSVTALVSCSQYASVSEVRPRFRPIRNTVAALLHTEQCIMRGHKHDPKVPMTALGDYLAAAEAASKELERHPNDEATLAAYNFAVSRVFGVIKSNKLDPWTQPLKVPAEGGEFSLGYEGAAQPNHNAALYDFTPSDQFDISGTYVKERTVKPGLGAPMVAVSKELRSDAKESFALARTYYGITALIRFTPDRKATIMIRDPLNTETVQINGHKHPLGADFTVPLAVMLTRENPKKLEISRTLNPEKYASTARVVRLQPYDPNKTVVLVVHGLMDSPATWTPILNYLRSDPTIRQKYQFWFYSYPSGYPYPYSAALLRKQLDGIEARYPLKKKMVIVGHSMGSLISRLMITDSGDNLWNTYFDQPPEKTNLTPETRQKLQDGLIFRHRDEIGRAVFICGPHRGADMAVNWLGRLGSALIRAPFAFIAVGNEALQAMKHDTDDDSLRLKRMPNSVDTLAPNNRFVKAINTVPITPGIPYHSIIGDRGKGGNKDKTKPVSSDGVVPYWSSHLEGAQSELIVPSNHSAHQNAQAMAEVRRILLLNAGVKN